MGKRAATLLIASVVGFAAPISLYAAGSRYFEPTTAADAMPAYEILTRLRSLALDPIGEPLRRGPYYILHAYDRSGIEMRVVADAHFGDVISVTPATLVSLPGAGTVGGARIIHVPAPGEEEASVTPGAEPELEQGPPDEPVQRPAAKPHPKPAAKHVSKREPEARRRPFSAEPPPPPPPAPAERRAVLTAPPPPAAPLDDGPTPLRPTPRFGGPSQATVVIPPPPVPPAPPASEPAPAEPAPVQD